MFGYDLFSFPDFTDALSNMAPEWLPQYYDNLTTVTNVAKTTTMIQKRPPTSGS